MPKPTVVLAALPSGTTSPAPHEEAAAAPKSPGGAATKQGFAQALAALQVDLSVPASPAFAVLGLSPADVQRPGTVRMLAASLARGFDDNGRAKAGAAVDFAPMLVFGRNAIRGGAAYASSHWLQILTRTTVSYGTTEGDDGGASKQAWGVRIGVFDFGDPGLQYEPLTSCLKNLPKTPVPPGPTGQPLPADEEQRVADAVTACELDKGLWAKPALYVGFGEARYSGDRRWTGTTPAAKAWWATYSHGMATDGRPSLLFQLHAGRMRDDRVVDPDDDSQLLRQDTRRLIGRLTAGQDKWRAFAELGRKRVAIAGSASDRVRHAGLGAEFKLQDDLWLQIGTVREAGFADGSSRQVVTSGLRFGTEPLFTTPGD